MGKLEPVNTRTFWASANSERDKKITTKMPSKKYINVVRTEGKDSEVVTSQNIAAKVISPPGVSRDTVLAGKDAVIRNSTESNPTAEVVSAPGHILMLTPVRWPPPPIGVM